VTVSAGERCRRISGRCKLEHGRERFHVRNSPLPKPRPLAILVQSYDGNHDITNEIGNQHKVVNFVRLSRWNCPVGYALPAELRLSRLHLDPELYTDRLT
jgi:hypothetical protein